MNSVIVVKICFFFINIPLAGCACVCLLCVYTKLHCLSFFLCCYVFACMFIINFTACRTLTSSRSCYHNELHFDYLFDESISFDSIFSRCGLSCCLVRQVSFFRHILYLCSVLHAVTSILLLVYLKTFSTSAI